jgi:ribosomal protein L30/L7E
MSAAGRLVVTLRRGLAGKKADAISAAASLCLRRTGAVAEHPNTEAVRGQINKVRDCARAACGRRSPAARGHFAHARTWCLAPRRAAASAGLRQHADTHVMSARVRTAAAAAARLCVSVSTSSTRAALTLGVRPLLPLFSAHQLRDLVTVELLDAYQARLAAEAARTALRPPLVIAHPPAPPRA